MMEGNKNPTELNDKDLDKVAGGENSGEYKHCLRCGKTTWFKATPDDTMTCTGCGSVIQKLPVYL